MGIKSSRASSSARAIKHPSVGVITPVRIYRDILVEALSRKLGVPAVDLLDGSQESIDCLSRNPPAVVIVDTLPGLLAELVHKIQRRSRTSRVVAIALEEDDGRVVALAEAGVVGFVRIGAPLNELISAVRHALSGELQCSPRVAAALAHRVCFLAERHVGSSNETDLTAREGQVLDLIDQRLSNKEIATRLSIEVPTVKNHVHNILEKLAVHRRADAAARFGARAPEFVTEGGRI